MTTTQETTAKKAAAKKSTPAPAKKPAAKKTGTTRFNPESLPSEGTTQYRNGGEYKTAIRNLGRFAKDSDTNKAHVKALIHLGWVKPGGDNNSSKSPAFTIADNADLPAACWSVGEPAGPQISANLQALAEAGAPQEDLDALWAAYVGV